VNASRTRRAGWRSEAPLGLVPDKVDQPDRPHDPGGRADDLVLCGAWCRLAATLPSGAWPRPDADDLQLWSVIGGRHCLVAGGGLVPGLCS
jgi:hypothetical protein